ncbi:MAG TPA: TetR/AcrR family transcriptional regulator [Solirubrobacteraceae bacterium]|nr:TetR/AcrR family transcriptional regulator [Solirubrobacteraceae bacterium]
MITLAQSQSPRARILKCALTCFLEAGYEHTTVARICERAEVSNGTLFHYFQTKEAIADALYLEAIADFQHGLWRLLAERPRSLRRAVRGVIAHQIEWIEANVERARFVYTRGTLDGDSPGGVQLAEMNRRLAASFQEWLAPFLERGQVRPMSMLALNAIVTGPTHAIARRWLARQITSPLHAYLDELADAAAAALAGKPATTRRPAPAAHEGRVRLELVSDQGVIVGRGEATAQILAVTAQ